MQVIRNGKFSMPIKSEYLSKGLRKTSANIINKHGLIKCDGLVGREGVLQRLSELTRLFELDTEFPYPQIFVETNVIIVCTRTRIYEYVDDYTSQELVLKYSVSGGSTWALISVHDFVFMSNGVVSIIRDPISKVYNVDADIPTAMAICNYNGQIIVGAPNAGYNLGD